MHHVWTTVLFVIYLLTEKVTYYASGQLIVFNDSYQDYFIPPVMRCNTLQINEIKVSTQCRCLQNMDAAMLDFGYMAFTWRDDNETGGGVIKEGLCEVKSRELDLNISNL